MTLLNNFCLEKGASGGLFLLFLLAVAALQAQDFTYTNINGAITITGYTGPGGDVVIPGAIEKLPVTRIGGSAFNNQSTITKVVIPDGVTSIESGLAPLGGAFGFCTSLTNVVIPNSVTNVGDYAFVFCTHTVGVYFEGNSPSPGAQVFQNDNNLTVFYLPGTTGWGPTFGGRPTAEWHQALDFTYTNTNGTITITGYTGPGGAVIIPSSISGVPVTAIGNSAFFGNTSLTAVTLPNGLTTIEDSAFYGCGNLATAAIPSSVTSIGNEVFFFCGSLTSFNIPNSVTNMGDTVFYTCTSLTNITIPGSVRSIGDWVFGNCSSLASVTIRNGITSIGPGAFNNCRSLSSIIIPDTVVNLKDGFYDVGGGGAFSYCVSLTNVTLGDNVTTIGDAAFWFCSSLTNIAIPRNVRRIGTHAFESCAGLEGVYFQGNAPSADNNVFGNDHNPTVYYLPETFGWGATFAGVPTVLWNPQAQTNAANFGVRQDRFGFNITGTVDIPLVVEASTVLAAQPWVALQNSRLTNGQIYFSDPQWTNYPSRFYRIRSP